MSATYDLTGLRRGNSYRRIFRFKDSDGNPVDLTGSVLTFVAVGDGVIIRKSTSDSTLLMPDPASGEISLYLSAGETRLLPVGRLKTRYEIERRIGTEETTLVSGCIAVMDGINDDGGDR